MKNNQANQVNRENTFSKRSVSKQSVSKKSALGLIVAASLSATVNANQTADETITVTATRAPLSIENALATVQVITQAEIARIQAKSVSDILATVAGLDISSQGGRGQNASLFVRGANSNHTLVLVDGVRVSSASLGSTNTQIIAPELIERIEILKGPRAAIWGSDAIGGVVQIFTRQLQGNEYFAGATVGADDYLQLKAGAGFTHGEGSTSITVNHEESEGFDVLQSAEEDNDGFDNDSVAIKGQQKITEQFSMDWMARVDHGEAEYDNAYGGNNETETRNHVWLVRGTYDQIIGHVQNSTIFSVGQNRDYALNFKDGTDKAFWTTFETKRDQFSVLNHSQVFPHLQFNIGADYYQERLNTTTSFAEDERDVLGVFAHALYNKNKVIAEVAVRHDDVENVDSETSYNLGAGYQLTDDTRIALNLGTAFKAPTFNDLYYPESAFASGNPDLVAETSDTIELVAETSVSGIDIAFNAYKTDIENLISWESDENFFSKPENVDNVEIKGADFIASYQGFGGQHQISLTYVDTEDKATGKQLIRRAKEQVSYQFDTQIGDVDLYLEYQFKGSRMDSDWILGDIKLDSYHLINLSASYPITDKLKVNARISNALDEEYNTAYNYNTQGRAAYFGISYSL